MILPRFSIRTALLGLTIAAFVSLIFREAVRGTPWALGVTFALISLLIWLVLMALFFLMSNLFRPNATTDSTAVSLSTVDAKASEALISDQGDQHE